MKDRKSLAQMATMLIIAMLLILTAWDDALLMFWSAVVGSLLLTVWFAFLPDTVEQPWKT